MRGARRKRDRAGVDRGRVDPARAHEGLQAGLVSPRQSPHPGGDEGAVLVQERDDVGHRRQRDEVEVAVERLRAERLQELEGDAGAAQLRERVRGRLRRDDRAVGKGLAGPVVVGDDDLEPRRPGLRDLLDGSDPAVDGEDERAAVVRQARQRLARHPVALLEAAGQVPLDVRAQVAQGRHGQRGRADAVHVVVAVDADPPARRDRLADQRARGLDVPEQERVVPGRLRGQEGARRLGVAVAAPDEDACCRFADAERRGEPSHLPARARTDRPGALVHRDPP